MKLRRSTIFALLAIAVFCLRPAHPSAQGGSVQVVAASAVVHLEASASSPAVTSVPIGATLEVVAQSGEWYQVKLPKDASGFDRVGFIQASFVKVLKAPAKVTGGAPATPPRTQIATEGGRRPGRPAGAVLDFEFGTVQKWWDGNWDIGKGISDLLVDELLASGEVRLIERKRLADVMNEQNFAQSNRADLSAANAAAMGRILGVNYFVTGSITKFGGEQKDIGGGALGRGILGGIGFKETKANVGITCRVIDATSSEIIASAKGDAQSKRNGLLLGAAGKGVGAVFNMSSSDFRETILGEATAAAVKDVAAKLIVGIRNAAGRPQTPVM